MINPSEIDLSSLPWLPLDEKLAFPRNPAIYFAIDSQGVVQYIGRSIDPKNRWVKHHKYNELEAIGNIKIVYLFVDSPELLPQIEFALILWFKPMLNVIDRGSIDSQGNKKDKTLSAIKINLKEIREARGYSQEGLARAVGVSLNTMQRWEYNQIRSASFETLEKLCEVLECEVEDLLEWKRSNS